MGVIVRNIVLILMPLFVLGAIYLVFDPFEVLHGAGHHYRDPHVVYNWDVNQTEVLRSYPANRFDSFIFGSSRSKSFLIEDWVHCIDSPRVFPYAAMAETLFGIERKVAFIDRSGMMLRNVLLVLDRDILEKTGNSTGHLFIKHPEISGGSLLEFHMTFFRAFLSPVFFGPYLSHRLGLPFSFATDALVFDGEGCRYDPLLGDLTLLALEEKVRQDPDAYYKRQQRLFYPRSGSEVTAPPVIGRSQMTLLTTMARIFTKHQTRVTVVITPLYDQIAFNPADREILRDIFGREHVFDYSGVNSLTDNIRNYYEPSHFRISVARKILYDVCRASAAERAVNSIRGNE